MGPKIHFPMQSYVAHRANYIESQAPKYQEKKELQFYRTFARSLALFESTAPLALVVILVGGRLGSNSNNNYNKNYGTERVIHTQVDTSYLP
jgi:hypothetical protein